jgi:hypothetical protein
MERKPDGSQQFICEDSVLGGAENNKFSFIETFSIRLIHITSSTTIEFMPIFSDFTLASNQRSKNYMIQNLEVEFDSCTVGCQKCL